MKAWLLKLRADAGTKGERAKAARSVSAKASRPRSARASRPRSLDTPTASLAGNIADRTARALRAVPSLAGIADADPTVVLDRAGAVDTDPTAVLTLTRSIPEAVITAVPDPESMANTAHRPAAPASQSTHTVGNLPMVTARFTLLMRIMQPTELSNLVPRVPKSAQTRLKCH